MTVILNQNLQSHVEDVAGVKWWSPHCWQRRDWWAVWLNTASVQSVTSWCFRWDWWKSQCYFNNEQREKSSWGSRADCGSVQRMTENNPMSLVILLLEEMLLTFGTKLIGFFFFFFCSNGLNRHFVVIIVDWSSAPWSNMTLWFFDLDLEKY